MKNYLFFILIIMVFLLFPEFVMAQKISEPQIAESEKTNLYLTVPATIQGGEITDGRDLKRIRWGRHSDFERIVFDIYEVKYDQQQEYPAEKPCFFDIKYEYYPPRFVITLHGIRQRSAEYKTFLKSQLIQDTYLIPYLDDAGIKFAVELNQPVEYEIFSLSKPGRIVIDIRKIEEPAALDPVFSVRTKKLLILENLAHLKEDLYNYGGQNIRILKSADGDMFLEESYYDNRAEAEKRLEEINHFIAEISSNLGEEVLFFIEKRTASLTSEN